MPCLHGFLLSRLLYTDRGGRLMGSLCIAILLQSVAAAAHSAGVMCLRYQIGNSTGLSATAGRGE